MKYSNFCQKAEEFDKSMMLSNLARIWQIRLQNAYICHIFGRFITFYLQKPYLIVISSKWGQKSLTPGNKIAKLIGTRILL
jgi:hypothetical protein